MAVTSPNVAALLIRLAIATRREEIAGRIRSAAAFGDVTAVEALVAELASRDNEAALARRIGNLATTFDFDALLSLADRLSGEPDHAGT